MRFSAVRRHTTTREPAEAIADVWRQAQPFGNDPLLSPDVDRQSIPLGHSDHLGIATDPERRSG